MYTVKDMTTEMVLHASVQAQEYQQFEQLPSRLQEWMRNGNIKQRRDALWLLDELELKARQEWARGWSGLKFMGQEIREAVESEVTAKTPLWRRRRLQASLAKIDRLNASIAPGKESQDRPKTVAVAA